LKSFKRPTLRQPGDKLRFANLAAAFGENSIQVGALALDRSHAVRLAGDLLVASGRVHPDYTQEMIDVLDSHGPYIVIAPGIALAHSKPSNLVLETGMSLVVLAEPIEFGNKANDPVRLVFGFCAVDHDSHLGLLQDLAIALSEESFVNSLLNARDSEHLRSLL